MEDILELYKRPYSKEEPVVCVDELNVQLVGEKVEPIVASPGHPCKEDYEYKPKGSSNVFMHFEPLTGKAHVEVTKRRTKLDWANNMKQLADKQCSHKKKIIVVLDNLNTHSPASFYEAFDPIEAQRLTKRFEFHYTPKHGSWLNMAELGLSILSRQCLNRRVKDIRTLKQQAHRWETHRNKKTFKVNWHFQSKDARIKLKRLYPLVEQLQ